MINKSAVILERIRLDHRKDINLSLRPTYMDLLAALGNPQDQLTNVIHVAGTNGKGSVCAFLQAMCETSGKTVNVYTSPHLVRFHERIRLSGKLIEETELAALLQEIEDKAETGAISYFEAGTAAALTAFARHKADVNILEVGLGGRLDATNVVDTPCVDIITRLSFDHREYLGDTMHAIAHEKAAIMRTRVPCYTAPQPSGEAMAALRDVTTKCLAPLFIGGEDWRIEAVDEKHFRFLGPTRKIEMIPRPALVGTHQLWNAGLAIAAAQELPFSLSDEDIHKAMQEVVWPGRLQQLENGKLADKLPDNWELWIDGGHNDSAGEALAAQINRWSAQDDKPLHVIYGMLSTKRPEEFLEPIKHFISSANTVHITDEVSCFSAEELAKTTEKLGIKNVSPCASLDQALDTIVQSSKEYGRILACGSLYLAGRILRENETF